MPRAAPGAAKRHVRDAWTAALRFKLIWDAPVVLDTHSAAKCRSSTAQRRLGSRQHTQPCCMGDGAGISGE